MLLVASAAAAHKLAAPASPTPAAAALRRALLFSGFEPPPRVTRLIEASAAQGALDDLDSASADFEATVRRLRDAAGFSGSPAWHDPSGLPWAGALEAAAPAIRAELLSVQEQQAEDAASWGGADYEAIAAEWRIFHLWKDGAWLPEAVARYPQTVALLRRLEASHGLRLNPLQNVACGFARQPPGSGIAPHCDGNLLGLTCHLGLRVPAGEECWIEVGGERRRWREGQLLLMDTTQTHSTRNGGECDRDILMLNVLRPELDAGELEAFAHYLRAPPLRLLALNPGWLSVPSGALCCAPSGEEEGREEGGAVRLLPAGPWLPQRPQGGTDGVVRFEPLSDRRYRVASGAALVPRELPSEAAAPSRLLPPLPPGADVEPCAAAIDAEGCLEWVGVAAGRESAWLRPSREGTAAEAPEEARGEEAQDVLLAHRRLLREPQRFLAWLPVYDADDEELLDLVRDSDAAGGQT